MSETDQTHEHPQAEVDYEPKGVVDTVSILYVLGGIPCMALFFVILFSLTGSCDASNTLIPA